MPNHSPVAIANEFLDLRAESTWPKQMFIQKLVNAAHGWSLAISGRPLVDEVPQAWDNGPVFRSIWDHIRDFGYGGENCNLVDPATGKRITASLTSGERDIIQHVWNKYSGFTSKELSDMTHEPGTPWYNAYYFKGRNSRLSDEDIRLHYTELAEAGRARRS